MHLPLLESIIMEAKIRYEFSAPIWQYSGPGAWCFVSLPHAMSKEIRGNLQWMEEGWGRLKVSVLVGKSQWQSAIWFDTKRDTYILPLKAEIRKREKLMPNQEILVLILI